MSEKNKNKADKLPGPCEIPEIIGRHMVTTEGKDPDLVWSLKSVAMPTDNKKVFYCRVFNESQASKSGIKVHDWNSLDEHRDLILWEGYYDKNAWTAQRKEYV